jgi:hypothetical protein
MQLPQDKQTKRSISRLRKRVNELAGQDYFRIAELIFCALCALVTANPSLCEGRKENSH